MSDTPFSTNASISTALGSQNANEVIQRLLAEKESLKCCLESKKCKLKIETEQRNRQYEKMLVEIKGLENDHSEHVEHLMTQIKDLENQVQQYSGRMSEISKIRQELDLKSSEFKDLESAYLELEQELMVLSDQANQIALHRENYRETLKIEVEQRIEMETEKIFQEINLMHIRIQAESRLHVFTNSDAAQELLQEALQHVLRVNEQISHLSKVVSLQQETICFLEHHIDADGEARLRAFFRQLRRPALAGRGEGLSANHSNDLAELLSASFEGNALFATASMDEEDNTRLVESPALSTPPRNRAALEPHLVRASFAATLSARLAALSPGNASDSAGRRAGPPWPTFGSHW